MKTINVELIWTSAICLMVQHSIAANPTSDPTNAGSWAPVLGATDEFTGSAVDPDKFYNYLPLQFFDTGEIQKDLLHNPDSVFVPANATVSGGKLSLVVKKDFPVLDNIARTYSLGAISSKMLIRNGYFEIKAKVAQAAITSAFWLNKQHTYVLQPLTSPWQMGPYQCGNEIDIFELLGNSTYNGVDWSRKYNMNALVYADLKAVPNGIWSDATGQDGHTEFDLPSAATPFYSGDRIYGFEWDDTKLQWYVDGMLQRTTTVAEYAAILQNYNAPGQATKGTGARYAGTRFATHSFRFPLQVILNLEYIAGWHGPTNDADLPATMTVDYLRVWQKKGTGLERVAQGDFSSSSSWSALTTTNSASATLNFTGSQANVVISSSGTTSNAISFRQNNLILSPNTLYSLNYSAQSKRPHWFNVVVKGSAGGIYAEHQEFVSQDGDLTHGHIAQYAHTFRTPNTLSGSTAEIAFSLGGLDDAMGAQSNRTVVIDNVSIKALSAEPTTSSLVLNGSFSSGTMPWVATNPGGGANLSLTNSTGKALMSGTSGGSAGWHSQLQQESIPLESGKQYRLSWKAQKQSGTGTRPLVLNLSGDYGGLFFGESAVLNVGTTQQSFSYDFTPASSTTNARITFFLGNSNAAVLIDDVEFIMINAPTPPMNVVKNGDFSGGLVNWVKWDSAGALSNYNIASGELVHTPVNIGTQNWHLQIAQENLVLTQGHTYNITFKARATANRTVVATLSGDYGSIFYKDLSVNLTTVMQTYTTSFTANAGTVLGTLAFFDGAASPTVVIDDVVIN